MPEDLQQLLSRINDGYLKQAEKEKDNLIAAAKGEAETIAANAKKEAERIIEEAKAEAEAIRNRYAEDIRRASRDSIRELRGELQRLLNNAVGKAATEAMTPAFMAEIIRQMADAAPKGSAGEVAILTAPRNIEALRNRITGTIRAEIKAGEFKGGMQVSFDKSGEYFDFSDDAVRNFFRENLGQELNKFLDAKA
ncbi:MAG: V-type ATP synthase subunit E [Lentisphaerae bacterium ADurb.Bin242]|nr:MAG: V-type ATP synthase subunit E [Lentisphaerae bacterium ADurb.Bin242]